MTGLGGWRQLGASVALCLGRGGCRAGHGPHTPTVERIRPALGVAGVEGGQDRLPGSTARANPLRSDTMIEGAGARFFTYSVPTAQRPEGDPVE